MKTRFQIRTFRSFSTPLFLAVLIFNGIAYSQTAQWQTTRDGWGQSGLCRLEANKIIVTIHPFHLDVEEDAIIAAEGEVWEGWGDPSTLEITGEFTFTPGTALRSLLLWNGDQILKAKLKDRAAADSAYEEVVDREKPQVMPRDPALVEYLGGNRYRYKIYPVAINTSRKIRILYSIPMQSHETEHSFDIHTAFTLGPDIYPSTIPVEIRKGESGIGKYVFRYGDNGRPVEFGGTYMVPYSAFQTESYFDNAAYQWLYREGRLRLIPDNQNPRAFMTRLDSGNSKGEYAAIFSAVPRKLYDDMNPNDVGSGYTIDAIVKAGGKSYITNLPQGGCLGIFMKTETAWDGNIIWRAYNSHGDVIGEIEEAISPDTASRSLKLLPLLWGAQFSLKEGMGDLGALYGFVDAKMSLLALETDVMREALAAEYAEEGVPALHADEIIIKEDDLPSAPRNNAIIEYTPVAPAPADLTEAFQVRLSADGIAVLEFDGISGSAADVSLVGLDGRLICEWKGLSISGGSVQFALPEGRKGPYILRVRIGETRMQKRVLLK